MPYKDRERRLAYAKEYNKKWYQKNKKRIIDANKINKQKHKQKWDQFKASQVCTFCGFSHPAAIDFHHVEERNQNNSVHRLVSNGQFARAYKEIEEECIPLCANCHRIHHWNEHKGNTI